MKRRKGLKSLEAASIRRRGGAVPAVSKIRLGGSLGVCNLCGCCPAVIKEGALSKCAACKAGRRHFRPTAAGRNDPCPCGSGKKYKRCHMPNVAAPEAGVVTWKDGVAFIDAPTKLPDDAVEVTKDHSQE